MTPKYPELERRGLKVFDFGGMPNVSIDDATGSMTPDELDRWRSNFEAWTCNCAGAVYAFDLERWFKGLPTDD